MSNMIELAKNNIQAIEEKFTKSNKAKLSFEREASFALQILLNNDYLANVAQRNETSLQNAVVNIANVGLTLNPAMKLAYLIPRKGKVILDVSYMGLIEILTKSMSIKKIKSVVVYGNEDFQHLEGTKEELVHRPSKRAEDRGEIIGAYSITTLNNGERDFVYMPLEDIYLVRNRSEGYKAYLSKKKMCTWITDEVEMIKKTTIRKHYKTLPKLGIDPEHVRIAIDDDDFEEEEKDTVIEADDVEVVSSDPNKYDDNAYGKQAESDYKELISECKNKNVEYFNLLQDLQIGYKTRNGRENLYNFLKDFEKDTILKKYSRKISNTNFETDPSKGLFENLYSKMKIKAGIPEDKIKQFLIDKGIDVTSEKCDLANNLLNDDIIFNNFVNKI